MTLETLVNHISSIKDDIKLAIKDKGITMAKTVPFEKYADYIRQIKEAEVGQNQIREWQPDPKWYDIDTILLNDTAVPELIVKDGIAEGFSRTSYIGLPQDLPMATANSWEMNAKFVFKRVNWQQVIYSEKNIGYLSCIGITADAKMLLELSNTHTDCTMGHGNEPRVTGETVLEDGKTYFVKATFAYTDNSSVYRVKLSETGAFAGEETTECEFVITKQDGYTYAPRLLNHTWSIGSSMYVDYEYPFAGKIDLTKCNITVNGSVVFNGANENYVVHNSTLLGEGKQVNPNYITINTANTKTAHTWEVCAGFKTDGHGVIVHQRLSWGTLVGLNSENKLYFYIADDNNRWRNPKEHNLFRGVGETVLEQDKFYYIKIYYEGSVYKLFLSETGEFKGEETLELSFESTSKIANATWNFGGLDNDGGSIEDLKLTKFSGTMDLAKCYMNVDNFSVWEGREIVDVSYFDDPKRFGKAIFLLYNWNENDSRNWNQLTVKIGNTIDVDTKYWNACKTCDGRLYTRLNDGRQTITHNFDKYFDKASSSTDVSTRYLITYFNRHRRDWLAAPRDTFNQWFNCASVIFRDVRPWENDSPDGDHIYLQSIKFLGQAHPSPTGDTQQGSWGGGANIFGVNGQIIRNYYMDKCTKFTGKLAARCLCQDYYVWPKDAVSGDKKTGLVYNVDVDNNDWQSQASVINIENCDFEHSSNLVFSNFGANGRIFEGVIDLSQNKINANKTYYIFSNFANEWEWAATQVLIKLPGNADVEIRTKYLDYESLKYLIDNIPEITDPHIIKFSAMNINRLLCMHRDHLGVYNGKEYSDGVQLLKAKGWTVVTG
jgi:hypothetical protein